MAKPKTSRQNQILHSKNQIPHGKSKYPRQNQSYFVFAVKYLVLPWCVCSCREVFGFAVTVVGHHTPPASTPLPAEFHTTCHLEAWHSSLGAHLPCRWSRFDYRLSCFFLFVIYFFCFRFVFFFFESYFSRFACFPLFSLLVHYSEVFAINVFLVMLI